MSDFLFKIILENFSKSTFFKITKMLVFNHVFLNLFLKIIF